MGERAWVINCFVMSMELKSPNVSFKLDRISDLEEEDVMLIGMCLATISLNAVSNTHSSSLKYWSYIHQRISPTPTIFEMKAPLSASSKPSCSRMIRSAWPTSSFSFAEIASIISS